MREENEPGAGELARSAIAELEHNNRVLAATVGRLEAENLALRNEVETLRLASGASSNQRDRLRLDLEAAYRAAYRELYRAREKLAKIRHTLDNRDDRIRRVLDNRDG